MATREKKINCIFKIVHKRELIAFHLFLVDCISLIKEAIV